MSKRWIAPLAGLLIVSNFAAAQDVEVWTALTAQKVQAPSAGMNVLTRQKAQAAVDAAHVQAPSAGMNVLTLLDPDNNLAATPFPGGAPIQVAELPNAAQQQVAAVMERSPDAKSIEPAELLPPPNEVPPKRTEEPGKAATVEDVSIWTSIFPGANNLHGVVIADADYMLYFPKTSLGTAPVSSSSTGAATAVDLADRSDRVVSGGRLALGYWMVEDNPWTPNGIRDCGAEVRFFFVGNRSANVEPGNDSTLYRPFFDLNDRVDSGFLVGEPGVATGLLNVRAQASLWGGEANVWRNVYFDSPGTSFSANVMAGVRYLSADTSLSFTSNTIFSSAPADPTYASLAGNRLQVGDSFSTRNSFYGGQIGVGFEGWVEAHINYEFTLQVALGTTSQDLQINGGQVRTFANGTTAAYVGGLYALPSNIGDYHLNKFTQVPELNFKLNFPVCSYLTLSTGFSALYWDRVLLAAGQVDRSLDISQIPNYPSGSGAAPTGLGRPAVPFRESDLWTLGISVGATVRW